MGGTVNHWSEVKPVHLPLKRDYSAQPHRPTHFFSMSSYIVTGSILGCGRGGRKRASQDAAPPPPFTPRRVIHLLTFSFFPESLTALAPAYATVFTPAPHNRSNTSLLPPFTPLHRHLSWGACPFLCVVLPCSPLAASSSSQPPSLQPLALLPQPAASLSTSNTRASHTLWLQWRTLLPSPPRAGPPTRLLPKVFKTCPRPCTRDCFLSPRL